MGVAVGPALGGVLTQLVSWRSIFLVQAPLAGLALVAAWRSPLDVADEDLGRVGLRVGVAELGLLSLFASLVGALFLSVLLSSSCGPTARCGARQW